MSESPIVLVWLRRDLRLRDNRALYEALRSGYTVLPVFIFDRKILDALEDRSDRRVEFIHRELERIQSTLIPLGSTLIVREGDPLAIWEDLLVEYQPKAVYTNRDYEPYARQRDTQMAAFCESKDVPFLTFKDQVMIEPDEVRKSDGTPYTVFTPYAKKWRERLREQGFGVFPSEDMLARFAPHRPLELPSLDQLGFKPSGDLRVPPRRVEDEVLAHYAKNRDRPDLNGTSRLSTHLRFGTISIRRLIFQAREHSEKYVSELIWREFYQMILWHFPQVVEHSFRTEYDRIEWRNDETEFQAWCEGKTGYPLVDAGMRELNATGYMHNRVRMVVASFLCKHLLIDWRWGEAYFAQKLLDFELASNNGGWQWAAGTGTDAAPYFRVFNPELQKLKFDPNEDYVKRWIPEYGTADYPQPIVNHRAAREEAIAAYQKGLGREIKA